MTRLIDADKLKQYIDDCECCEKCEQNYFKCYEHCELPDFLTPQWERVLNEQPTVDTQPVRHGHWVGIDDEPYEVWECDMCGYIYEGDFIYKYCPNCGAKMDGDKHGK